MKAPNDKITYEIIKGKNAPCELISINKTSFGGNAKNFIVEGTYNYCKKIMNIFKGE